MRSLSILYLTAKRKRIKKSLGVVITLALFFMLLTISLPGAALASEVEDVVTQVGRANYSDPEFDFSFEDETGLRIDMSLAAGYYGNGYGALTVLGPVDSRGMQALLSYVDTQTSHTSIDTQKMKGCEVRRYTLHDGAGAGVVLPDYFITVEFHETGNSQAADIQTSIKIAQQTLDGLERAGLLSQAAPDITQEEPREKGTEHENKPVAAGQVGTPLDEPTAVSDTMNIAGVFNGATVPNTFTINAPHLVTEIHTYHWNNAQGKTPGTIGLQDQNGKMYGPWQAIGAPGQGGVPDANWLVYPSVIVPAGIYTIIDSDPGTWSQNAQSGGIGMGSVKATPHFEVEPGPAGVTEGPVTRDWDYPTCDCEKSPAGVGSVGNIPGPSNTTEAVTGVVVPGLIATALGALGGLGGGGFIPPAGGIPLHPTGGSPLPGTGGSPGTGGGVPGATQATGHLGRRGKEKILVDPAGMSAAGNVAGQVPDEGGILIDPAAEAGIMTADSSLLIDGPEEAGIFIENGLLVDGPEEAGILIDESLLIDGVEEEAILVQPGEGPIMDASPVEGGIDDGGIFIDGPEEAAGVISSETDILIDTAQEGPGVRSAEAEMFADGSEGEILIDTSAVKGKPGDETGIGLEDSMYDQDGYNQEGFDAEGYDKEGYNQEGFDAEGYDKEGFNQEGFDAEGYDKEGYNQEGFDAEGYDKAGYDEEGFDRDGRNSADYDREGYNSQGFDKDGFDREGFDKNGYDQAGFDQEGYDKNGFDQSGFDKEGFDAEGYNKEGFDQLGFDQEGFDKNGFDAKGYDREGFDKAGFDREGFDQEGFNKEGFDQAGFDRNGFDRNGFDEEGFNKAGFNENGYDREGFDAGGFDREGYNAKGFDKEGFDRDGFDGEGFSKEGLDREGFDKNGFDANGYDREGFNKAGYDQDGYGRNGFDAEGFDRDGFNVNGYDRLGYDRQGFDAQGYNKNGFDKAGFNQEGFDRDGYDKNGFNKSGWDREGYDKNGYDAAGYNRDGYNREGQSQEGYDADGYDKKGFNEHGYDRDGYDRDGFNFEGYSRSGRDPWGYDKQGYGKDGYHWSGYDADGYDRNGRHWSEGSTAPSSGSSFGPDSPFNVSTDGPYTYRTPFTEGPINLGKSVSTSDQSPAIYQGDDYGNLPDAAGSTKPPLGQPYPKTVEKYGAKTWGDTIPDEPEHTAIPIPKDSGAIGPEDPMSTLDQHGVGPGTDVPEGQVPHIPIPDEDLPVGAEIPDPDMKIPVDMPPVTGPRHGDTITLPGKDGHEYVLDYNEKTGEWENLLTGGKVRNEDLGSYIDDFNRWQDDVAEDLRRSALDLEKMANREDASSRAIDEAMSKLKQLDQMEIAADKYGIGQHGGPGDISKAIQDLRADMAAGKKIDDARMEQLKNIIKNRVAGVSTGDSGTRYEEDWFKNLGFALEANMATAKEVVTGQQADGSISWKGMAARVIMTTATGGVPGKIIDGSLTVAEAMTRIQESVDQGETSFRAISKAVGILVLGEQAGYLAGKGMGALNKSMLERFPVFTNKAADFVEKAILKGSRLNQQLSRKLGLISQESAESALNAIKRRLGELGSEQASDKFIKQAVGRQGAAAGGKAATSGARAASKTTQAAGKTTQAASKTTQAAGKTTQAAGKTSQVAKPTGKPTLKTVSAETPGLKIDKNSFKEAGLPPDLRGMPARDQKAVQTVCDKYGVKAHMRPTNPESRVWLESGKAHPKPEMLKAKTINNLDVELGYPKENIGTVGCRRPDPLPASKPSSMTDAHWNSLQKRHTQRMTEFTDQAAKLKHLEKQGKIVWDQKTGIIYNKQTMKPYCGDHDTFALVDAVSGKPVSPRVNEQINREMQSLGATQHPEHVGWDYSGLSDKVPDGAVPGAQSPREIAEAIDQKILGGHGEGGEALNTYDPLRGEKGGWTTNWWKGGTRA